MRDGRRLNPELTSQTEQCLQEGGLQQEGFLRIGVATLFDERPQPVPGSLEPSHFHLESRHLRPHKFLSVEIPLVP